MISSLFSFVGSGIAGFMGLVVLAVLFGKRMETKWDLEAKFRDEGWRELGEFDIELRREVKGPDDWNLEASFVLRHLVMRGQVEKQGRIRMNEGDLTSGLESPAAGQICSVRVDEPELFAEALYRD